MTENYVTVGSVDEVPEGQARAFAVGDQVVAVFHHGGQFFAIEDSCPHMGAPLSEGFIDNGIVVCPWHGWRFDVRDGTWCDNPRVKIGSYPVRVVAGEIQIALPPKDTTQPTTGGSR